MGNTVTIDCEFPGGNVLVDGVSRGKIQLHQAVRDTEGDWFYWYFRVQNAAGRKIAVKFTRGKVVGARGPAISLDGGSKWFWFQAPGRKSRQEFMPNYSD